jgi:hypothetical protein
MNLASAALKMRLEERTLERRRTRHISFFPHSLHITYPHVRTHHTRSMLSTTPVVQNKAKLLEALNNEIEDEKENGTTPEFPKTVGAFKVCVCVCVCACVCVCVCACSCCCDTIRGGAPSGPPRNNLQLEILASAKNPFSLFRPRCLPCKSGSKPPLQHCLFTHSRLLLHPHLCRCFASRVRVPVGCFG